SKHVFHPELPNLAFVGMVTVGGPLPPVAEMQARWVARVLAGAVRLPSPAQMRADVTQRRALQAQRSSYPLRVQLLDYLDEIAAQIGVRPQVPRHLPLAGALLLGPALPAHYRLNGPGAWTGSAALIRQSKPHDHAL